MTELRDRIAEALVQSSGDGEAWADFYARPAQAVIDALGLQIRHCCDTPREEWSREVRCGDYGELIEHRYWIQGKW